MFLKKYHKCLGVEIEFSITKDNKPFNDSPKKLDEIISYLNQNIKGKCVTELGISQIEYITPICYNLKECFRIIETDFNKIVSKLISLGYKLYPNDSYRGIKKDFNMSYLSQYGNYTEKIINFLETENNKYIFCNSIHVHFGVLNKNEALKVYNKWCNNFDKTISMFKNSKRLEFLINYNKKYTKLERPIIAYNFDDIPVRKVNGSPTNFRLFYIIVDKEKGTVENRLGSTYLGYKELDLSKVFEFVEHVYNLALESIN